MSEQNKRSINLYIADNPLSGDGGEAKIFKVSSTGTVDMETIVDEISRTYTLIPPETIRMLLQASQRIQIRSLLEGKRVNMGMYTAELQSRGTTSDGNWNPDINSLYANFHPGKELREAVAAVSVKVVGEKGAPMCVTRGESPLGEGFTAIASHNFTLTGKYIKVAGDDPSVGVTLTSCSSGDEVRIGEGRIAVNLPSKLILQIPSGLPAGDYALRVTTQFTSGGLLKSPRGVEVKVRVEGEK